MGENQYNDFRRQCIARLKGAGICGAESEFDWLAEELLGITKLQRIQEPALRISLKNAQRIEKCIKQRITGDPLQYILGKCYFLDLPFVVQPGVLIPRYDTERLAVEAISQIGEKKVAVLDLCTGCGCIGLSVLRRCPNATCTLADISEEALSICKINAELLALAERCQIVQSDLFISLQGQKFDYILCNPPYIKAAVIETLAPEVKDREPEIALCGGADGLDFYRAIIKAAPSYLNLRGKILFEIGYDQAEEVRSLLEIYFHDVRLIYDYGGNPRVLTGQLSCSNTV